MNAKNLIESLRTDCLHYQGDRPCKPHVLSGAVCTCSEFSKKTSKVLLIKLGAAGDVLRTTPLLRALKNSDPGAAVLLVTNHPEFIPSEAAEAVKPTASVLARIMATSWDMAWNLDKDMDACALMELARATVRKGFGLRNGVPYPLHEEAWHKFATGIDDPYSRANTMSYPQEIFEIVGMPFQGEEYWLKEPSAAEMAEADRLFPGHQWIGLNTGAGWRWPTRLWPIEHWVELGERLLAAGYAPLIMGGPEEVERNASISAKLGAPTSGVLPLGVFYGLVKKCATVVTSVTQMMHLAIGARRPLVLLNNIFNRHEFELYGRGCILEPPIACDCFYKSRCQTGRNCIGEITPEAVFEAVRKQTGIPG